MYIAPNSTIKIIYQCPLDKSYENTLWFDTLAEQTTYFITTLGGYTFQNNSYQRVNKGVLRIAKPAEEMYDCNYLAFKNTSFGAKWFYAFIDKIEYVNNITSEIYYTIDVIQTWHFDYYMEQCFVEREHSTTDEIGDNIVEENLDTGEFVCDEIRFGSTGYTMAIWGTIDYNHNPVGGVKHYSIFPDAQSIHYYPSGLYNVNFPVTSQGLDNAYNWISGLAPIDLDSIVCITIMPSFAEDYSTQRITIGTPPTLQRIGGNVKNNKLYTYPYSSLYLTNNKGQSAIYKYEFFDDNSAAFRGYCDVSPLCTYMMIPEDYKGIEINFDERLELSGFPQVAYNVDAFKAWYAQAASSILTNLSMLGIASVVAPEAAVAAAAGSLISTAVQGTLKSLAPPQARGQQGGMALVALDKMTFTFIQKHVTKEYATIIDDYFSMYGYATKRVKYPNRDTRPEWNYVKTIGCKIRSGIPSDDATTIESLYDRGIRFWKNPQHIGNYTFDNSPVTQNNPNIPSA